MIQIEEKHLERMLHHYQESLDAAYGLKQHNDSE